MRRLPGSVVSGVLAVVASLRALRQGGPVDASEADQLEEAAAEAVAAVRARVPAPAPRRKGGRS